jgi:hypothetical protein
MGQGSLPPISFADDRNLQEEKSFQMTLPSLEGSTKLWALRGSGNCFGLPERSRDTLSAQAEQLEYYKWLLEAYGPLVN